MTGMAKDDPYDLQRFVTAQDAGGTYQRALAELRAGPQDQPLDVVRLPADRGPRLQPGLAHLRDHSLAEAEAYLAHPVLGARLTECAGVLAGLRGRTAEQVFGEVDALKLCSSMTLFLRAAPGEPVFRQVLEQYFSGMTDPATEQRV